MREKPMFSIPRARILTLVHKKELTISEIQKKTKLGRSTIYHHLEELKKRKLIIERKDLKKHGQPVYITTNKSRPYTLKTLDMMEKMLKFLSVNKT